MAFYDLEKQERAKLVAEIGSVILLELKTSQIKKTLLYFKDEDTHIRKSTYLNLGRIYFSKKSLQKQVIELLKDLFTHEDFKVRQTVINASGEIGKKEFDWVRLIFWGVIFKQIIFVI
jgi:hypothetical protein